MIIDSHAHINSKTYGDVKTVITKINKDDNIKSVINVGLDILSSQESVIISEYNEKFFSSIGIHPLYIENNSCDNLYNLVSDKVVAIGEIGLDYLNKNI